MNTDALSTLAEKSLPPVGNINPALWSWGIQAAIIIGVCLIVSLIVYRFFVQMNRRINAVNYPYASALLRAARIPFSLLTWVVGLGWLLSISKPLINLAILQSVPLIQRIVIIIILGWFFIQTIRYAFAHLKEAGFKQIKLSPLATEALFKLLQVSVLISVGLLLLQSTGISISGLLAFGGLGGLVVSFAAKDTLANLFSGIMLYMDHPFQVGERIQIPGKSIEGTVEHIGWRQTCVRDYAMQPIYIPNSLFGNSPVLNPSRMLNRRVRHTVGIRYQDFAKIEPIVKDIKKFLQSYSGVDQKKAVRVNFIEYGASSLNLEIYCFTTSTGRDDFLRAQEDILLNVGCIIHAHQSDFAFPTQTLDIDWQQSSLNPAVLDRH